MKDKILIALIVMLSIIAGVFWIQKNSAQKREFQANQKIRTSEIAKDSLTRLSDGYYQKLVADTLTGKELKRLAEEVIELKNRKPISVTKIIVQPTEVVKDIDSISVAKDSVFIEDFYPKKEDYFLKYTNRFSLKTEKGLSNFKFNPINLTEVVTKKEDGLYQVDFKGPDFLEVNSINIQTTPVVEPIKDNWGTLIGIEYGKNLEFDKSLFELNVYQRYKKFYIGGSVNTREEVKAGIKIEF